MAPHPSVPAVVKAHAEEQALQSAFRLYARYVGAVALRILGNPDEVEDLIQDVFLAAVKNMPPIEQAHAVKQWLAKVTVRISVKRLRRRRWRALFRDDGPPLHDPVAPVSIPEDRLLLRAVYQALEGVAARQRVAWTLRYLEGHDLQTVAELCDCSLATAKRWISSTQEKIDRVVDHE